MKFTRMGLTIDVSGTAGQVREAFGTEMHKYVVNGKQHIANAGNAQIPAALAPVVVGFVALDDFMPNPALSKAHRNFTFPCAGCPDGFDGIELYNEAPADFATIYNVSPLYKASKPITGKGQTIVVIEDSDANPADVATFRKAFGLSSYSGTLTQIHPGAGCVDPGLNGAEVEAAIDAEWAGAVAPDASVEIAACADTATTFGFFIAAQNLIDSNTPPPIMSASYGVCETTSGPSLNAYIHGLWQQAARRGNFGVRFFRRQCRLSLRRPQCANSLPGRRGNCCQWFCIHPLQCCRRGHRFSGYRRGCEQHLLELKQQRGRKVCEVVRSGDGLE